MEPHEFSYQSMGTTWEITIWDDLSPGDLLAIKESVIQQSQAFDQTYSRFIRTSLVWKIAESIGVHEVPEDLTGMLRLYQELYTLSGGKLNPLIGFTISDLGYDADYSLQTKDVVRKTPPFDSALSILDDTHIETKEKVLIDLGALGKGYFVDVLSDFLESQGIQRFLVNGSGDIRYKGEEAITAGLEHPFDKQKVIGSIPLSSGAMCASGVDRRTWDSYNHVIDPHTSTSPTEIVATWVTTKTAALADALATCLFMVEPERFTGRYDFEYCLVNDQMRVKKSDGFQAEFY